MVVGRRRVIGLRGQCLGVCVIGLLDDKSDVENVDQRCQQRLLIYKSTTAFLAIRSMVLA